MPAAFSAATCEASINRALLEHELALADGVDDGAAIGVPWRDRAELHAACSGMLAAASR